MNNPAKFSNNDLTVLEEIIHILEPFYEISIKCQAEAAVTVSLVVPSIVYLTSYLRDIQHDISFCLKLVEQLQKSINIRFSGIINRLHLADVDENNPYADALYLKAAVLDPCFKFYWIRDLQLSVHMENRLKQNIIQLIIDEMNEDTKISNDLDKLNSSLTTTCSTSTPKPKRRKLFKYDDSNADDSNESKALDPAVELNAYLNDPVRTKFSDYWYHSQLRILKKMAKRIFSVQASSVPAERAFSHAGLILSQRRSNMNEHLFRDLVFLRVNQKLL